MVQVNLVSQTLYFASIGLIGLAVFIIARSFFADEDKFRATEKLENAEDEKDVKSAASNDFVLKYSRPFFKRYFSPIVQGMKNKQKIRDKYKRKLFMAGLSKEMSPEDFMAFKLFLVMGFPIIFLGLREFLEETWPLALTVVLPFVGYQYPDIWLNGRIEKRKKDIVMALPFIVDMLALSVEAGLDFMAAITKVVNKAPKSALTDEFEVMIKETKVGATRAEALRGLSWRTDVLVLTSFTATLIAADSVGASIGPILKTLAGEMRQKRSAEAEKAGATAATKILFPMMGFIVPAVFIIIAGPLALQMIVGGQ